MYFLRFLETDVLDGTVAKRGNGIGTPSPKLLRRRVVLFYTSGIRLTNAALCDRNLARAGNTSLRSIDSAAHVHADVLGTID